eukprot:CAMPEP_0194339998 /NCGR_PEP_ID=MMETSP0171-20130528/85023_2 /TAXON_ID=218684 /ORGANISM="Corethron pennatum, Strain L29A3" /LENGTH=61 /DNA_ID=CAMNT_0039104783 /DNA_START=36 /DNA_END=217 /DNA_ORIENTATION=-
MPHGVLPSAAAASGSAPERRARRMGSVPSQPPSTPDRARANAARSDSSGKIASSGKEKTSS